ncbi:hypothetical protein [Agathobacter sp.]
MNKKKVDSILKGITAAGIALGGVSSIQGADMVLAAVSESTADEVSASNEGSVSESESAELSESTTQSTSQSESAQMSENLTEESEEEIADEQVPKSSAEVSQPVATQSVDGIAVQEAADVATQANGVIDKDTDTAYAGCYENTHHMTQVLEGEEEKDLGIRGNGYSYRWNEDGTVTITGLVKETNKVTKTDTVWSTWRPWGEGWEKTGNSKIEEGWFGQYETYEWTRTYEKTEVTEVEQSWTGELYRC